MCGRFSLVTSYEELAERFGLESQPDRVPFGRHYNIPPGQEVAVVPNKKPRILDFYKWGLVPHWAKRPDDVNKMINARAESVFEKPFFSGSIRNKRCLIPADGFYEWKRTSSGSIPFRITLKNDGIFAFAGIYDIWENGKGELLKTCAILTSYPNELVSKIHSRMPVILDMKNEASWLDEKTDRKELEKMLKPIDSKKIQAEVISKAVNNPRNDDPRIIQPIH